MRRPRLLRPIRAFACPRDLKLVKGTVCQDCEDHHQGERPHRRLWVGCSYPGGGPEYAKFRAEMEGPAR